MNALNKLFLEYIEYLFNTKVKEKYIFSQKQTKIMKNI